MRGGGKRKRQRKFPPLIPTFSPQERGEGEGRALSLLRAKDQVELAMDRKEAEELARAYREFGDWFNRTTSLTMSMPDAERAKQIRHCLADMSNMLDDAVRIPVSSEYTDLFSDDVQ